tara:strand:+ start:741 stop:1013 length:273 start_codon:yes stop_codon:yes gene_type:complete
MSSLDRIYTIEVRTRHGADIILVRSQDLTDEHLDAIHDRYKAWIMEEDDPETEYPYVEVVNSIQINGVPDVDDYINNLFTETWNQDGDVE